jgi:hypothetical protein
MLVCKGRSNVFDISKDCLAGILGKREARNSSRLAGYADRASIPIDIIELHRHDVAGAQPEPSQQQDHCSVAKAGARGRIACRDNLFHGRTVDVARDLLGAPLWRHAKCGEAIGRAFASGDQESNE